MNEQDEPCGCDFDFDRACIDDSNCRYPALKAERDRLTDGQGMLDCGCILTGNEKTGYFEIGPACKKHDVEAAHDEAVRKIRERLDRDDGYRGVERMYYDDGLRFALAALSVEEVPDGK